MERLRNFLVQFYRHIVFILFSLVLVWLVLLAGFGTAVIQTPSEENWLVSDSMIRNLVLALAAAAATWLALRRTSLRDLRERLNDAPLSEAAAGGRNHVQPTEAAARGRSHAQLSEAAAGGRNHVQPTEAAARGRSHAQLSEAAAENRSGQQSSFGGGGSCAAEYAEVAKTACGHNTLPRGRGNASGKFSDSPEGARLTGEALFRRIRMQLLIAIGAVGVFLVLSLRVVPTADQSMILLCAQTLNKGDNTYLQLGQYLQGRQNQFGIVFLLQIYIRIFGAENYLPFQILNVVGLVVIYYELSELGGMLHMSRFGRLVLIAFGVVFLPLALYTTFFYGTILGLAFSLAALRRAVLFGRSGVPSSLWSVSWKDALLCAVYIVAACVLKSNYIIFLVGIVIYALIAFLRQQNPAQLGLVGMIVLLYIGQSAGLSAYFNRYLEEPMADGMSAWSYVAMGLQECSYATDGWFNGYNTHSYEDSGYDTQVQAQMSLESIAERLAYFAENPGYAVRFFSVKVSSEWNDPLFQGEWIVATRESEIETAAWTEVFSDALLRNGLVQIYNAVQFLLLFGVLMFVILSKDRGDPAALLLEMIFFGGFLFHLFWEAKAQYTLPYYMLLLPLSVQGYHCLLASFDRVQEVLSDEIRRRRRAASAIQVGEPACCAAGTGDADAASAIQAGEPACCAAGTGDADAAAAVPAGESACCAAETGDAVEDGSEKTRMRIYLRKAGTDADASGVKEMTSRAASVRALLRRRETVLIAGFLALCLAFGLSDGKLSTYAVKLTDSENTYEEYLASYQDEMISMTEELASE